MNLEYIAAGARPELPIILLHGSDPSPLYDVINSIRLFFRGASKAFLIDSKLGISSKTECKIIAECKDKQEGIFRPGAPYQFTWNLSSKNWYEITVKLEEFMHSTDSKVTMQLNTLPEFKLFISNQDTMDW